MRMLAQCEEQVISNGRGGEGGKHSCRIALRHLTLQVHQRIPTHPEATTLGDGMLPPVIAVENGAVSNVNANVRST